MAASGGIFDFMGDIIADIRQRVIEEGWFGRRTTPLSHDSSTEMDVNSGWTSWRDCHAQEVNPPADHDHGIGH